MDAFLKGSKFASSSNKPKEKGSGSGKQKLIPWVEKYRPKTVDDVAYQDEVVSVLRKSLQGSDLPNLLFYGPPGTGKTSTILAAARDLYGPDLMKERVLELNASDERGISVVREKVKNFSNLSASGVRPDGKRCPPFKIIILDEADSMTNAAQSALRRTMEKQMKTTRFCLICNYVSRIIEPITSRCAKFRFKPLASDILQKKLKEIADKENVKYDQEAMNTLMKISDGDLRKAITFLQSASRLKVDEPITEQDIIDIVGVVPDSVINDIIKTCESDSFDKLEKIVKEVMAEGHSAIQILLQLHDVIVMSGHLKDQQKAAVLERLAVVEKRLSDGADEYLQIMDLCSVLMWQICHA